MFDFFEKVLGFIESFFEFFINFLENLFVAVEILVNAVAFPFMLAGLLPSIIGSALLITVAIAVAKFIIGR